MFGQFKNVFEPELIGNAMINIGFDDWFEVARGADIASALTRELLNRSDTPKPLISNACPVVTELILFRYHGLVEHLSPLLPPLEISALRARRRAKENTGLEDNEIGIFFISPCSGKICSTKKGLYTKGHGIDGVLSAGEVCYKLMNVAAGDVSVKISLEASNMGMAWATGGGEASNILKGRQLAADGIGNAISVLRELESGKLNDIDFIELNACPGGCVGGVLNRENPFVCKSKIHAIRRTALFNKANNADKIYEVKPAECSCNAWEPVSVFKLDENFAKAFEKLGRLEALLPDLPGLDCGFCGAPTCRAFAEDIVNGKSTKELCVKYK
jgi:iron only hydrogenase large subunit-like protein